MQVHAPARIKTDSVDAFMQETRATKRISMRIIQVEFGIGVGGIVLSLDCAVLVFAQAAMHACACALSPLRHPKNKLGRTRKKYTRAEFLVCEIEF